MPYIYRILRDGAHIKSHVNYLKKRLTFLIQILKLITVAGTEKKNKKVAGP
jgi:hypothetical protein